MDMDYFYRSLRCDYGEGLLFWKEKDDSDFATYRAFRIWNSRWPGKEAFTHIDNNGYKVGCAKRKGVFAHKVIWSMYIGEWCHNQVDHINGDRLDNRIDNLREVTPQENCRNIKIPKHNTSGILGVSWNKQRGLWSSTITINKKTRVLGYFTSKEEAGKARQEANLIYGFHENHGRR